MMYHHFLIGGRGPRNSISGLPVREASWNCGLPHDLRLIPEGGGEGGSSYDWVRGEGGGGCQVWLDPFPGAQCTHIWGVPRPIVMLTLLLAAVSRNEWHNKVEI